MREKIIQKRLRIAETLNELLADQDFQAITVLAVCEKSGVPRASFYRQFYNLREVGIWLFDYLLDKNLTSETIQGGWEVALESLYNDLLHWKAFFVSFFRFDGYDSVFSHAARSSVKNFLLTAREKLGREITEHEKNILRYHGYVQASLTAKWATDGMTIPPKEMASIMIQFLPALMREYIEPR